ncbi:MAG: carboxymuconolactone decarboxylase family protein [Gammaproteobacteria bacterium]|nr:carboxymuconolactone decarboxylase family protein [Gammaproteobacteria bacterium]
MARVPYKDIDDLPEEHRDLLARPINLHRALVNSPEAARNFGALGSWIRYGSRLDPRLRELAILQVGYLARSPYEYSHHLKIGRDFGVTEDDVYALIDETEGRNSGLPALDRAVLRAAREMTEGLRMSDECFDLLHDELSDELIVDLTLIISFYNAVVRVLGTLEIDVEPDYAPYLEEFPLPR